MCQLETKSTPLSEFLSSLQDGPCSIEGIEAAIEREFGMRENASRRSAVAVAAWREWEWDVKPRPKQSPFLPPTQNKPPPTVVAQERCEHCGNILFSASGGV